MYWWRIETEVGRLPVFGWFSCRVRWGWEWLLQYPGKRRGEQGSRRGTQAADQVVEISDTAQPCKTGRRQPKIQEPRTPALAQDSGIMGLTGWYPCVRKEAEPQSTQVWAWNPDHSQLYAHMHVGSKGGMGWSKGGMGCLPQSFSTLLFETVSHWDLQLSTYVRPAGQGDWPSSASPALRLQEHAHVWIFFFF